MKKKLEGLKGGLLKKLTKFVTSAKFIITFAVLVVLVTLGLWQYHNSTNADRVFWGMVDDTMQTTSYTRHAQQKSGSQSVDQVFITAAAPQHKLFSDSVFTQTGVDSATAVTENLGTPTADYVRYTQIETAQDLDFRKLLNIWGVAESQAPGKTAAQLYNQAVLGVIPTGNLSAEQRREVIKIMRDNKAYSFTLMSTKRSLPFGRPTLSYNVIVNPVGYISALKQFATYVGLNHLEEVNPADYESARTLSFMVDVDGWSHQMTAVSQIGDAKIEDITGRNMKRELIDVPSDAIPVEELQAKLQAVQ